MLSLNDHRQMMRGFVEAGFTCIQEPSVVSNPLRVEWHADGHIYRYRLWAFDITHGGGGSEVRAADEFRIQITNGPAISADLDSAGATDLLIGYSRDRDAIVAYDRRWLTNWTQKKQATGSGGSPSVQVKEADIKAGHQNGIHRLTKDAGFGQASIVTLNPNLFPAFLANHVAVLGGGMTAAMAQATTPPVGGNTVLEYCATQGFPFDADLVARYIAALMTKPFVILAGVSGTG